MEHDLEPTQNQNAPGNRLTVILVVIGIVALLLIGVGFASGVDNLKGIGSLVAMIYVIVLIGWLATIRPNAHEKPDFFPLLNLPKSYWAMLGLISILAVLAFALTGPVMGNGWLMVYLSTLLAMVILIILRKQINQKIVLAGGIVAIALFVVELVLQPDNANIDVINSLFTVVLPIFIQAVAGILLLNHTGLTKIQLYDGNIRKAIQSFGWGCTLAIPPALLNIASLTTSHLSEFDREFDQWWKAFYALQPGILEETWARLFLLTLFYALLRPTSSQKPQRALTAALIISVFIHGLAHYPASMSDPMSVIFAALMYGIPLGLIYIKRDFESAVAYHFFVDFVRFAFTVSLVT